jgi:hypothetical protein
MFKNNGVFAVCVQNGHWFFPSVVIAQPKWCVGPGPHTDPLFLSGIFFYMRPSRRKNFNLPSRQTAYDQSWWWLVSTPYKKWAPHRGLNSSAVRGNRLPNFYFDGTVNLKIPFFKRTVRKCFNILAVHIWDIFLIAYLSDCFRVNVPLREAFWSIYDF